NPAQGKDAHQGVVLLYRPDTGEPMALINASALTEIRTAAASAVATSLLARRQRPGPHRNRRAGPGARPGAGRHPAADVDPDRRADPGAGRGGRGRPG